MFHMKLIIKSIDKFLTSKFICIIQIWKLNF